jgi:branched-chain amino acid transport system substrate-binding protein
MLALEIGLCRAETVRGVTPDSIRIGLNIPLTKLMANAGRLGAESMKAYFDNLNASGGINGRKIILVIDDSQLDPSVSLGIFKKQLAGDNIFAHICWGTPASGVLIKPAMEAKMPLLILSGALSFCVPPKEYVFCFLPPYELQAASAVTYIHDVLKKKDAKIAIFWRNDDYGKTALVGGRAAADYYKYKVVAEPSYMSGQAIDFTSEVMKIRRAKADFVLLGSAGGDVAGFLREAKNQGLQATIMGALSPASERKILEQAGDAAENYLTVCTTPMFRETNIPGVKKWIDISKKYVSSEILSEESFYYIVMVPMFDMIEKSLRRLGPNPTADGFIRALETIKDDTSEGLGPPVTFSSDKHYSAQAVWVGKANVGPKDFDRLTDWIAPPADLVKQILNAGLGKTSTPERR